jgi:hypothetical protein
MSLVEGSIDVGGLMAGADAPQIRVQKRRTGSRDVAFLYCTIN